MEAKDKKESSIFLYFMIGLCLTYIILILVGIVAFANREDEVIEKVEHGGNVTLSYTSNVPGLTIKNAIPITDEVGMINEGEGGYFDFSVDVSLDNARKIEYEISAVKSSKKVSISDDDIRIYLEKEENGVFVKEFGPSKFTAIKEDTEFGSKKGSMVLAKVKKTKKTIDSYRLRMWLSDKSLLTSGDYGIEIVVNGKAK